MWSIFEKIISFLPKIVSWWLYQEKKTLKNIKLNVRGQEGLCEINCGNPPTFTLWIEVHNNNPFPIDIDRIIMQGSYGPSAQIKAKNLIGGTINSNKSHQFLLRSYVESSQLDIIRKVSDEKSLINYCEINLVLSNRYNKMRYRENLERLICKTYNKHL